MTKQSAMTPENRVLHVIGGNFTADALGPAYQDIRSAILADPERHVLAFERIWLTKPDRTALTDLHLPAFLALVAPALPERSRAAAQKLATHMAKVERAQEAEANEGLGPDAEAELDRQRRQLKDRQQDLQNIINS